MRVPDSPFFAAALRADRTYRGASAAVVESKITQVIESQIAGLEGVETLRSSSFDERSRITIEFSLDRDIESAANDVRDRVARVVGALPEWPRAPRPSWPTSNKTCRRT